MSTNDLLGMGDGASSEDDDFVEDDIGRGGGDDDDDEEDEEEEERPRKRRKRGAEALIAMEAEEDEDGDDDDEDMLDDEEDGPCSILIFCGIFYSDLPSRGLLRLEKDPLPFEAPQPIFSDSIMRLETIIDSSNETQYICCPQDGVFHFHRFVGP
jgi:hypothetical protein